MKAFLTVIMILGGSILSQAFSCDIFSRFQKVKGEEGLKHAVTHALEPLIFAGSVHHSWDQAKLVKAIKRNENKTLVWDLTLKKQTKETTKNY